MPIAFFTRTQTGALISRLNNDVIGAQQAFTDTLSSVVSNLISVILVLIVMFFLSWQITLISLIILPIFVFPAKRVGRRLSVITRESYGLNAQMNNTMNERFNVSGALLVKLFGRPEEERDDLRAEGGPGARHRGHPGHVRPLLHRRPHPSPRPWPPRWSTAGAASRRSTARLELGTVVALAAYLTRLYGPLTALSNVQIDVMTALVSFDRVFEVLDLPPMIAEKPDARPVPPGPARIEFDHVDFRYPTAEEVSLASLESVAVLDPTVSHQVLFDVSFVAEPGQLVALVGPSGAGQDHHQPAPPPPLRRHVGSHPHQRDGRPRRHLRVADRHHRGGHPGRPPVPRDHPREPALRQARRHRRRARRGAGRRPDRHHGHLAARRHRHRGRRPRLPALRRREAAPGPRPDPAQGPEIVVLDEATAHLDSESEAAVQKALATALLGRTSLVIAHRLSTVREADLILVLDHGRIVERGRHDELLAAGGLYAELYRIQFERQEPFERGRQVMTAFRASGPVRRDRRGSGRLADTEGALTLVVGIAGVEHPVRRPLGRSFTAWPDGPSRAPSGRRARHRGRRGVVRSSITHGALLSDVFASV